MLQSSLIGGSADLAAVAAGARRIQAPENSDAVARIQQALICCGFELPSSGIDGHFGDETGRAVVAFKTARNLFPNDPVVGVGTTARLDLEVAYLEGVECEDVFEQPPILASDSYFGGILDNLHPDRGIPDKILRFFELSDEFCFPLSPLFGTQVSSLLGRLVEPKFKDDYCQLQAPCTTNDFFDIANSPQPYTDFLRTHNPAVPEATIVATGSSVRPDIMRHSANLPDWYEIKPLSPSGVTEWLLKARQLNANYLGTFPYLPGKRYNPSREIELGTFFTIEGENLQIFIEPSRPALGMILYRICVRGDYVKYFNRVRLTAGILAILVALAPELLAVGATAAEVAAFVETITALAAQVGAVLPALTLAL
ncbi:hypothetical protein GO988_00045 [Hymenobacter sp. HMF4947]|uniref:Peptidoglycan binding-like domain-containing protein n=1 Tax=Hymenobacter ginkgonis TaxID=2682976 RepID=A0A7K1T986_9BACT|nr:peptidoglycan-binding domain-containing protein [Hymenobacter ginkgonis]MVN74711.1 hypothetical protein [Hymenobacter ginkgonis]